MQLRNAKITSTTLGFEDHGILTAYIHLNYGSSGQSFGGFGFGPTKSEFETNNGFGASFIATVLDIVDVDKWENISGRAVRVIHDHERVYAIGHLIENKWFYPGEKQLDEVKKIINDLDMVF